MSPKSNDEVALDMTLAAGAPSDASVLPRGASIGRYVVIDRIGEGGMGVVYAAYDPELDRRVAIKLLQASERGDRSTEGRARLLREAQAIARIAHPNVVGVHDVGTFGDGIFVAMEYVEGTTLRAWLAERPRAAREILAMFLQAGRGLAAAHAKGLVHRDFKPDNVIVGNDSRARVLDFGLAQAVAGSEAFAQSRVVPPSAESGPSLSLETPLTQTGVLMGTPLYMAPEQFLGKKTDSRTDQYSFCCALLEALWGEHPIAASANVMVLADHVARGELRAEPLDPEASGAAPSRDRPWHGGRHRGSLRVDRRTARGARAPAASDGVGLDRPRRHRRRDRDGRRGVPGARCGQLCDAGERELAGVWDAARKQAVSQRSRRRPSRTRATRCARRRRRSTRTRRGGSRCTPRRASPRG